MVTDLLFSCLKASGLATIASWGIGDHALSQLQGFIEPTNDARPLIRWWWIHGLVDNEEVLDEIGQIAKAGFGGIELQDVHHSYAQGTILGNLTEEGWAAPKWYEAVEVSTTETVKREMRHDMAIGPCWPMGVPGYTPDDIEAAKEIVFGKALVNGTSYSGPIPEPWQEAAEGVTKEELFALQGWKLGEAIDQDQTPLILEKDSLVDLKHLTTGENDNITWTPPDNGTWIILSTKVRGTGQVPEDSPHTATDIWVGDHFSSEATTAATGFWDRELLPRLGNALGAFNSAIFEDSLELVATTHWTPQLPNEFLHRWGYNIATILPSILLQDSEYAFAFSDTSFGEAAKHDYYDVLTSLYIEHHIKPLGKWAKSRGLRYRAQPYAGFPMDGVSVIPDIDIPEGESLGFSEGIDNWRAMAGANNMAQKTLLSNELGAYPELAYGTSWKRVISTVNPQFAAGVNHNVIHGFSYLYGPNTTWPGYAAFTPNRQSGKSSKIGYSESVSVISLLYYYLCFMFGTHSLESVAGSFLIACIRVTNLRLVGPSSTRVEAYLRVHDLFGKSPVHDETRTAKARCCFPSPGWYGRV